MRAWQARPESRSSRRPDLTTPRTADADDSAPTRRAVDASEIEFPGSRSPATTALRQLEVVGLSVERAVSNVCRTVGLSHAAVNALAVIEGNAAPISSGDLAARMHVTTGTITSLTDNLERRGLVVRLPDPADRRRVLVDITPAAQALLDQVLPAIQQLAKAIFESIDDRQIRALLGAIDGVHAGIRALPDELPTGRRIRPAHLDR